MEELLNLGFLFADDPRLYQVDKKKTRKKLTSTTVKVTFKSERKTKNFLNKWKPWEFIALVLIVLYVKKEQWEKTDAKDHNSDLQIALK